MRNFGAAVFILALLSLFPGVAAAAAKQGEASAGGTIVLGASLPLSGKYSINGRNTFDGYTLAIKRINELGGVKIDGKAYQFKLVHYDDESLPAKAAENTEKLIARDGIKFMLGSYSSALIAAAAPVSEKHKIPMVQSAGGDRALFRNGYKYFFGVLNTAEAYMRPAVALLAEHAQKAGRDPKALKVALAIEPDPFSRDIRNGVLEDVKNFGMQVIIDEELPKDLNDMAGILKRVQALKPDLFIVSGHEKGAVTAARQIAEMQIDAPMVGVTHCDSAQLIEKFGKAVEYFVCPAQWDDELPFKDRRFGSAKEFAQTFKKEFKYEPSYAAAQAAAAVLVFADAFERADSLNTEKLRAAIVMTNLRTLFGDIRFDETGKNVAKTMVLYQILGGEFKVVAPSQWTREKLIYPMPAWSQRP